LLAQCSIDKGALLEVRRVPDGRLFRLSQNCNGRFAVRRLGVLWTTR